MSMTGVCVICRTAFTRKRRGHDAGLCCSRTCGFALMRRRGAACREGSQDQEAVAKSRMCPVCGASFAASRHNQRYCATFCRRRAWVSRAAGTIRICVVCNGEFTAQPGKRGRGYVSRRLCSAVCRERHRHHLRRRNKTKRASAKRARLNGLSGSMHVRRARRAGVAFEVGVTPLRVFARDGWRCRYCGVECDRTKGRRCGAKSWTGPNLDHIIPIAKGGGHVWTNVQLLCRRCNTAKGDRVEPAAATLARIEAQPWIYGVNFTGAYGPKTAPGAVTHAPEFKSPYPASSEFEPVESKESKSSRTGEICRGDAWAA